MKKSSLTFNKKLILSLFLFCTFSFFSRSLFAQEILHEVREGETLGSILQAHDISPLWGPKGNILKTIQLNPDTITGTGDLPPVGTVIRLPYTGTIQVVTETPKVSELPIPPITIPATTAPRADTPFLEHTIQKGDTIGTILQQYNLSPLWGPTGYVQKTIELNQDKPNFVITDLKEGTSILLPTDQTIARNFLTRTSETDSESEPTQMLTAKPDVIAAETKVEVPKELASAQAPVTKQPEYVFFPNQHIEYIVQPQDTIGSILQKFNISPLWGAKGHVGITTELNKTNPAFNINDLKKGSRILLPIPKNATWDEEIAMFLYPKSFEDLVLIKTADAPKESKPKEEPKLSQIVNTKRDVAMEAKEEVTKPLEIVSIPVPASKPPEYVFVPNQHIEYIVQPQDTIGSVLQKFNISPLWGPTGHVAIATELNKTNPAFKINDLKKGSRIFLPIPKSATWDEEIAMFLYPKSSEELILVKAADVVKETKPKEEPKLSPVITFKPDATVTEEPVSVSVPVTKQPEYVFIPHQHIEYIVQPQDTIGTVLQKFNITPLWGARGHVAIATELNKTNPAFKINDLKKGTRIFLPIPKSATWDEEIAMFLYPKFPEQKTSTEKPKTEDLTLITLLDIPKETLRTPSQEVSLEPPPPLVSEDVEDEITEESESPKYDISTFYLEREREYGPLKLRDGEVDNGIRKGNKTYFWYRVKRQDTISDILYANKVKPLWGHGGFVTVTVRINDGKVKKNGDRVAEGEWIRVPIPQSDWVEPETMTGPAEPEVKSIEDDIPMIPPLPSTEPVVKVEEKTREVAAAPICEPTRAPSWLAPDIIRKLEEYERLKRMPQAIELHTNPPDKRYGDFKVMGQSRFSKIATEQKSDGAKAVFSSKIDVEGSLDWSKSINQKWSLAAGYQYRNLAYKKPSDRSLFEESTIYQSAYIGGVLTHSTYFRSAYNLGYQEKSYLSLIAEDEIRIIKIGTPFISAILRYDLVFYGPLYISVEGGGKALLPGSNGSISSDLGFEAYALLEQRILLSNTHTIGINIRNDFGASSTNATKQTESAFGIGLFWIWSH